MRLHHDQQCSWPGFIHYYDTHYDPEAVKAETARLMALAKVELDLRKQKYGARNVRAVQRRMILHELRAASVRWQVGDRVALVSPYYARHKRVAARVVSVKPLKIVICRGPNSKGPVLEAFVESRMLRKRG